MRPEHGQELEAGVKLLSEFEREDVSNREKAMEYLSLVAIKSNEFFYLD